MTIDYDLMLLLGFIILMILGCIFANDGEDHK